MSTAAFHFTSSLFHIPSLYTAYTSISLRTAPFHFNSVTPTHHHHHPHRQGKLYHQRLYMSSQQNNSNNKGDYLDMFNQRQKKTSTTNTTFSTNNLPDAYMNSNENNATDTIVNTKIDVWIDVGSETELVAVRDTMADIVIVASQICKYTQDLLFDDLLRFKDFDSRSTSPTTAAASSSSSSSSSSYSTPLIASVSAKEDFTPVTVADFIVQAFVAIMLRKSYPRSPLVAEETSEMLRSSQLLLRTVYDILRLFVPFQFTVQEMLDAIDSGGYEPEKEQIPDSEASVTQPQSPWKQTQAYSQSRLHHQPPFFVLDPIDGTKAFIKPNQRNQVFYVIGLALLDSQGHVVAGVMASPNYQYQDKVGCVVKAARRMGTQVLSLSTLTISSNQPPQWASTYVNTTSTSITQDTVLVLSEHEEISTTPLGLGLAIQGIPLPKQKRLAFGSLCKLLALILGDVDAMLQHPRGPGYEAELCSWDWASGVICVLEAGGWVADFQANPLQVTARGRVFRPGGDGVLACASASLGRQLLACIDASGLSTRDQWNYAAAQRNRNHPLKNTTTTTASFRKCLVCLDRDGTLNVDVGYPGVIREQDLYLLPAAKRAVHLVRALGHDVVIVTNQSSVGNGIIDMDTLEVINRRLMTLLGIEYTSVPFYICPHSEKDGCDCRKPKPAMLQRAIQEWIDKTNKEKHDSPRDPDDDITKYVFYVGDQQRDMLAAEAAGVKGLLVASSWYGQEQRDRGLLAFNDVEQAIKSMLLDIFDDEVRCM